MGMFQISLSPCAQKSAKSFGIAEMSRITTVRRLMDWMVSLVVAISSPERVPVLL
jgi:hypothetical protein